MTESGRPPGGNELFPSNAWRLLLPDPSPETVIAPGSGPVAVAARGLQPIGRTGPMSGTGSVLAAADDLGRPTMEWLFEALPPGGTAYLQGPWPRWRGTAAMADKLRAVGFDDVAIYSLSPSSDRWRVSWWIPVGRPEVIRYLIDQNRRPLTAERGVAGLASAAAGAMMARLAGRIAGRPWLLHPRRRRQICVVAGRPPAPSAPAVDRAWLSAALPVEAGSPVLAMRVGGSSTDQPMALVFEPGRSEPATVVKVPDRSEELTASRHELRTLRTLASAPVPAVPRVVELPPTAGVVALGQSYVPGRAMTGRVSPKTLAGPADAVTEWLIELAAATRQPVKCGWYPDLIGSTTRVLDGSTSNGRPLLPSIDRVAMILADFDPGLVVCCHRDLGPWNIHLDRHDGVGIIDWAGAVDKGPPGTDLVHFLTHLALVAADAYRPDRRRRVAQELSDPATALGALAERCLGRYERALGIDLSARRELRILAWALAARRQTPEDRPGSIYTALLSFELDRLPINRRRPAADRGIGAGG